VNTDQLDVTNARFVDDLYQSWTTDPSSVDEQWRRYFASIENGHTEDGVVSTKPNESAQHVSSRGDSEVHGAPEPDQAALQSRVDSLLWAYRDVGYIHADINPLKDYTTPELRYMFYTMEGTYEGLSIEEFGLSPEHLDREFSAGRYLQPERDCLRNILARMSAIYCGTMGVEILHIQNKPMRRWLIEKLESPRARREWSPSQKRRFQKDLIKAEEFERFLQSNYIGQKRFSLEGGEALVPAVRYLIDSAAAHGIQEIVIGMAHRGRLNLFTNALRKPGVEVFAKFEDNYQPQVYGGNGDVKYHLGHSFDLMVDNDRSIHISLVANPSHLEAVDPVVEGKARGIQRKRGDKNRKKVMPVLIHGDAAFSGQGVVAETFNLSQLKGYRTGGTVHIIVNNQIGFTTASRDSRSTFFATDIAKSMPFPVFHANGDDPEAVGRAVDLAMRYRQKFGYDAVVDILCYRKLGHNEADEPSFSHPLMYNLIRNHPSAATIYGKRVDADGSFPIEEQEAFRHTYVQALNRELEKARAGQKADLDDSVEGDEWQDYTRTYSFEPVSTAVPKDRLDHIAEVLTTVPEGFNLHPKLLRFVSERRKHYQSGTDIDWAFAESLAFGSLLMERHPIRLSGEDSGRGTFSQRHAVWWDTESSTPRTHIPLRGLSTDQGWFSVYDSPLSEYAVLGFDYGYSLAQPNMLVLWEAQFGDFVNGAQVVIDQFIAAGESKWFRSSGLVMLLPHGYEGQGPEHSSGHVERFLQLCADENLQVAIPSTPAQYFHVLRRQMAQTFRKPLILFTPKSLLRAKACVSNVDELTDGGFATVIDDSGPGAGTRLILLCSGKVYYELANHRIETGADHVRIVRIEQLYPFDRTKLSKTLDGYPDDATVRWVQEEARNHGAWSFIRDRVQMLLGNRILEYVGRAESPSPATGSFRQHKEELAAFLGTAFRDERR
jgi:2-oxoglutarate dehydrogenase E1 component